MGPEISKWPMWSSKAIGYRVTTRINLSLVSTSKIHGKSEMHGLYSPNRKAI